MNVDARGIALGFLAAVVVLAALLGVVGVDRVVAAFGPLRAQYVLLILAASTTWLGAWALSLRTVLAALDIRVGLRRAFLLYASAAFANNVTPFGQAGGEPVSALLISRATDAEYETGLAAIASVDTLNFFPSILLALLGLGYYVTVFTLGDRLLVVLAAVIALAVGIPAGGYAIWTARRRVGDALVGLLTPVLAAVGRVVPMATPPDREQVDRRVTSFFASVDRVAGDRSNLLVALGFSTLGWLCLVAALWLSLFALGHVVPIAAALVAVPVGAIAGVTPLPGGLGGVEFAVVLVVVPITGLSAETATAAAFTFRGATYWFTIVVGGASAVWLQRRTGWATGVGR